jgi:hypothetical protein
LICWRPWRVDGDACSQGNPAQRTSRDENASRQTGFSPDPVHLLSRRNPRLGNGFIRLATGFAKMPSTVIRNTRYDPETRTLSVWFVPSGYRYEYEDVDPATYDAFRKSFSKGIFFNEFIRDHHTYRRVE